MRPKSTHTPTRAHTPTQTHLSRTISAVSRARRSGLHMMAPSSVPASSARAWRRPFSLSGGFSRRPWQISSLFRSVCGREAARRQRRTAARAGDKIERRRQGLMSLGSISKNCFRRGRFRRLPAAGMTGLLSSPELLLVATVPCFSQFLSYTCNGARIQPRSCLTQSAKRRTLVCIHCGQQLDNLWLPSMAPVPARDGLEKFAWSAGPRGAARAARTLLPRPRARPPMRAAALKPSQIRKLRAGGLRIAASASKFFEMTTTMVMTVLMGMPIVRLRRPARFFDDENTLLLRL